MDAADLVPMLSTEPDCAAFTEIKKFKPSD